VELLVQEIPAQTFRPLKPPGFDFAESIQVLRKRFKVGQSGTPARAIIKIHADRPASLNLVRLGGDTALSLRCSDDTDAHSYLNIVRFHKRYASMGSRR
jgi:hypothetical protein